MVAGRNMCPGCINDEAQVRHDLLVRVFERMQRMEAMYAEIEQVRARYPDLQDEDDPWEGPPRYRLRCYHCGRTHPECGFYPIASINGPMTHGRGMQLCHDCDKHLR